MTSVATPTWSFCHQKSHCRASNKSFCDCPRSLQLLRERHTPDPSTFSPRLLSAVSTRVDTSCPSTLHNLSGNSLAGLQPEQHVDIRKNPLKDFESCFAIKAYQPLVLACTSASSNGIRLAAVHITFPQDFFTSSYLRSTQNDLHVCGSASPRCSRKDS